MKKLIQLGTILGVFYIGNEYFNEYVNIGSIQTLIITSVLMVIASTIYGGVITSISKKLIEMVSKGDNETAGCLGCLLVFIIVPSILIWTPLRLFILEAIFNDFIINGFWTYVLISLILIVFNLNKKQETK